MRSFITQLAEAGRLAREAGDRLSGELAGPSLVHPSSDRFGAGWLRRLDADQAPALRWGRIVDAIPFAHAYRVSLGPQSFLWCSALAQTGLAPFGAKQAHSIPLGSFVWLVQHPQSFWGSIVGVCPAPLLSAFTPFRSDYLWPGSRAGIKVDAAHRSTIQTMTGSGGAVNFSDGRPLDGTTAGEYVIQTETGLTLSVDSFLAQLRADEETGLFAFLHDQLCRVSGHNLQVRSWTREREDLDDEGELTRHEGEAPYFWERLGVYAFPGVDIPTIGVPYVLYTAAQTQGEEGNPAANADSAAVEPVYEDQQPFWRRQDFGGYLGQGGKRTLCLPPLAGNVQRYADETDLVGVFEETLALTGAYHLRSAKRVILAKRPSIPVPKALRRPEDADGDTRDTYRACGHAEFGLGSDGVTVLEPHVVHGENQPDLLTAGQEGLVRAAAVLDVAAYAFNWEGLHPFFYHRRDWYLPEEGAEEIGGVSWTVPNYAALASSHYLAPPTPEQLAVDHRYGTARYWPNESLFALLDSGEVVIAGGGGEEIKMVGGDIFISAPGHIWLQPGRNLNVWAGHDVVLKAHDSIDLTASYNDVRIKAEHNCMILGGNDLCGGVLIESRTQCPGYDFTTQGETAVVGGIVMKACSGQVVAMAKDVVLRSSIDVECGAGDIILDAGDSRIKMLAEYAERFLSAGAIDFFTTDNKANEWSGSYNSVQGDLRVGGKTQLDDCLWVHGWVSVTNGHISTSDSTTYGGLIPALSGADTTTSSTNRTAASDRDTYLNGTVRTAEQERVDADRLAAEDAEFSLRTDAQYGTLGMLLFESRWQQSARLGNVAVSAWTENSVTTSGGDTYPHPGDAPWRTETNYKRQNLLLYDVAGGSSVSRDSQQTDYEDPQLQAPVGVVLNGNYPIIGVI